MICSAHASPVLINDGDFAGTVTNYGTELGPWSITGSTLWTQYTAAPATGYSVYSNEQGYPGYAETLPFGAFVNDIEPVLTVSPAGGAFIGDDGHYPATISQAISGLTPGSQYDLSFYQAAAVETSAAVWPNAALTSIPIDWQVSLGGETQASPVITLTPQAGNLAYGHTTPVSSVTTSGGWELVNLLFTATSSTETLAFLAQGPGGVPPIAFLSSVSLSLAPVSNPPQLSPVSKLPASTPPTNPVAISEPAQWAMLFLGLCALAWATGCNKAEFES
ncbi:MAG: hypothetical protein PHW13_09610 [Methylococcales bacterium]|nr:hypothetical protein [Methylococcales bacterium]